MASRSNAVWAVDIGNHSLKALHLSVETGVVEVIGFDNIQHGKILAGSGIKAAEKDELIALSLRRFAEQNDLGKDDIVISVPSQNSFARFVNLPPVEPKRIPEIVKFEAAQQIPFDIDDVQWDWQLMTDTSSPETQVGIFAIKNEVVTSALEHFGSENLKITCVQMAPMALYNYVLYDRPDLTKSDTDAVVVLNIGAGNTDLVVCTKSTVWQRGIPMGGNTFTKAVADTFKLSFEKAEKLKRTAAMSKYARQIFQAMRPVFTDLASEIQRSLGFYSSSNPNTKLVRIIALGGGTKMRGLLKYLQQTLQVPIERPDSFKKLAISSDVSAAKFHDSVCDFGVVYGLALQGVDLAKIESNLLPRSLARSMAWAGKTKYFTAAACMLLLVSLICFARTVLDRANYANNIGVRQKIGNIINTARQTSSKLEAQKSKASASEAMIQKGFELFEYRDVVPLLHQIIFSNLPNEKNNPEQRELYKAFADGDVKTVLRTPRKERKQIFITNTSVYFAGDIETAKFGAAGLRGRTRRGTTEKFDVFDDFEDTEAGEFSLPSSRMDRRGDSAEAVIEEHAGFVLTISGYSPYKNIGELLDPAGVENDPNKWGFVTRLLHLDDVVDGNSPFELYKKGKVEHFNWERGEVGLDAKMPAGIGIGDVEYGKTEKAKREQSGRPVLIDPMTKEIIGKIAELDEDGKEKIDRRSGKVVYKTNDHWFVLNVKFIWRESPKAAEEAGEI